MRPLFWSKIPAARLAGTVWTDLDDTGIELHEDELVAVAEARVGALLPPPNSGASPRSSTLGTPKGSSTMQSGPKWTPRPCCGMRKGS